MNNKKHIVLLPRYDSLGPPLDCLAKPDAKLSARLAVPGTWP